MLETNHWSFHNICNMVYQQGANDKSFFKSPAIILWNPGRFNDWSNHCRRYNPYKIRAFQQPLSKNSKANTLHEGMKVFYVCVCDFDVKEESPNTTGKYPIQSDACGKPRYVAAASAAGGAWGSDLSVWNETSNMATNNNNNNNNNKQKNWSNGLDRSWPPWYMYIVYQYISISGLHHCNCTKV